MSLVVEHDLLEAARDWLADCAWQDMEPEDFSMIDEATVVRAVTRHYQGGWEQFSRDAGHEPQSPIVLQAHPRGRLSPLAGR